MKTAIMQPYLFPYIGYFQLIHSVDTFVFFDDVQFIKKGWINRNRILQAESDYMFSVPLVKASRETAICDREISPAWDTGLEKFCTQLTRTYGKAPEFGAVMPVVEELIRYPEKNLSGYIANGLVRLADHFGIETRFMCSSDIEIDEGLRGQDRILAICKVLGTSHYINAIGGMELYDKGVFEENGINLSFLKTNAIQYAQFNAEFVPWLSILDVMMFNPVEKIRQYLDEFQLV